LVIDTQELISTSHAALELRLSAERIRQLTRASQLKAVYISNGNAAYRIGDVLALARARAAAAHRSTR
jgi:hypothetical protein